MSFRMLPIAYNAVLASFNHIEIDGIGDKQTLCKRIHGVRSRVTKNPINKIIGFLQTSLNGSYANCRF